MQNKTKQKNVNENEAEQNNAKIQKKKKIAKYEIPAADCWQLCMKRWL